MRSSFNSCKMSRAFDDLWKTTYTRAKRIPKVNLLGTTPNKEYIKTRVDNLIKQHRLYVLFPENIREDVIKDVLLEIDWRKWRTTKSNLDGLIEYRLDVVWDSYSRNKLSSSIKVLVDKGTLLKEKDIKSAYSSYNMGAVEAGIRRGLEYISKDILKSKQVLGCSKEELSDYLEQTWLTRYGSKYEGESVHVDHIVPISSAKTLEDVIKLNHYSNLQYLKPKDNLIKSNKIQ